MHQAQVVAYIDPDESSRFVVLDDWVQVQKGSVVAVSKGSGHQEKSCDPSEHQRRKLLPFLQACGKTPNYSHMVPPPVFSRNVPVLKYRILGLGNKGPLEFRAIFSQKPW